MADGVRVAFVGCGNIARYHATAALKAGGVTITALVRERSVSICRVYPLHFIASGLFRVRASAAVALRAVYSVVDVSRSR